MRTKSKTMSPTQRRIEERVIEHAELMLVPNATVRKVAARTKVSKSTVHKDLVDRLPNLDSALHACVDEVLQYNKNVRHLRGGDATRDKYLHKRAVAALESAINQSGQLLFVPRRELND